VNYGSYFLDISKKMAVCKEIKGPLDFSIILNRLYLDYYKNYNSFWKDINLLFEQVETFYKGYTLDITIVARRLKRVAIYMYQKWHKYAKMIFEKTKQIDIRSKSVIFIVSEKNSFF
jgi:hypothetical protein